MKTSTKFLTVYIFIALTTTLVMFILSKKLVTDFDQADFVQRKSTLPPFSVIVAMGNTEFNIEGAETNNLVWRVPKKTQAKMHGAKLLVRNDTLFVQKTDVGLSFDDRVVICCKSLKAVVASHRDNFEIRKLNTGSLRIQNTNSKVVVNNWFDGKDLQMQKLLDITVEAMDSSEVTLFNMKIGKLSARISNNSELTTWDLVRVGIAEVNLSGRSSVKFVQAPRELQMIRDSTCSCRMW